MSNIYVPKKFPGILEVEQTMGGMRGEYLVQIMRPDGSRYCPLGENYQKNLILDSLLWEIFNRRVNTSIMTGTTWQTAPFTLSLFLCSANVSSDPTPAHRSDLHRENWNGTQQLQDVGGIATYASSQYTFDVIGDEIHMFRDFIFDRNTTINPIIARDCWISCQRSNIVTSACTSRFVFPQDVVIYPFDRLIINYRLVIKMPYIKSQQTDNAPFYLNNGSLNFDGNWGFTSSVTRGLFDRENADSNLMLFSWYNPGYVISGTTDNRIFQFYINSNSRANEGSYGVVNSISGIGGGSNQISPFGLNTNRWSSSFTRKIGFYPTTHTPVQFNSSVDTGNLIPSWTPVGPRSLVDSNVAPESDPYFFNFQQSDSETSIDHEFIFPAHTEDRTVGGIYFNALDTTDTDAVNAHWLKFNTPQTIPKFLGIIIKLRWKFGRL